MDEKYNLGYATEMNHFVECALAGTDADKGLRGIDGLEALRLVKLIYKSAAEGVRINNS